MIFRCSDCGARYWFSRDLTRHYLLCAKRELRIRMETIARRSHVRRYLEESRQPEPEPAASLLGRIESMTTPDDHYRGGGGDFSGGGASGSWDSGCSSDSGSSSSSGDSGSCSGGD